MKKQINELSALNLAFDILENTNKTEADRIENAFKEGKISLAHLLAAAAHENYDT